MHSTLSLSNPLLFGQSAHSENYENVFVSGKAHMYRAGSFASRIAASVKTGNFTARLNWLSLSSGASQAT